MNSPLQGLRVIELENIGPVAHAAMLLADLGADVVRITKPRELVDSPFGDYGRTSQVLRGRRQVSADLKDPRAVNQVLELIDESDVLIEGYRPGVAERLGLGPDVCGTRNPRLIYARMTGWGQDGPRARHAGHDINYLSVTGALHALGPRDRPWPPLSLVGDYGGGSMFLITGILSWLWRRERTGVGGVIDAAMVDGVAALLQPVFELFAEGVWTEGRADNVADGAAPYYRAYLCSDGGFMAVGAVERRFYDQFVSLLGLDGGELPDRDVKANWPVLAEIFEERFLAFPREHWDRVFTGTDACVTPVLTFSEAPDDPQVAYRGAVRTTRGGLISGVVPRTVGSTPQRPPRGIVTDAATVLETWRTA